MWALRCIGWQQKRPRTTPRSSSPCSWTVWWVPAIGLLSGREGSVGVTVFGLLEEMQQTFSLDNGLAIQELLLAWLRLLTVSRKTQPGNGKKMWRSPTIGCHDGSEAGQTVPDGMVGSPCRTDLDVAAGNASGSTAHVSASPPPRSGTTGPRGVLGSRVPSTYFPTAAHLSCPIFRKAYGHRTDRVRVCPRSVR